MKSFENSTETPSNNFSENEAMLDGMEKGEVIAENQKEEVAPENTEKSIAEKADNVILTMRKNLEIKEKGTSFEKLVAKGAVGFAVIATLMSSPQFNSEVMATEDDIATKLNKEFSDFADKNLAERIDDAYSTKSIEQDNSKEKLKETAIVQFLRVTNNISEEDAESAYKINKTMIDGKLKDAFGEDGKTMSSISVLPEGGAMISFSGNIENLGDIPAAFIDNLKEIKDNPIKFISNQVLNVLIVDDAKESVGNFIEEHTEKGELYPSY